jgi:hypothetical protein
MGITEPKEITISSDADIAGFRVHEDDLAGFEGAFEQLICERCHVRLNENLEDRKLCPPECNPKKMASLLCQKLAGVSQVVK